MNDSSEPKPETEEHERKRGPGPRFHQAGRQRRPRERSLQLCEDEAPPEPNGWMHIGHAKAFSIDYYVAKDFGGTCNLRFDDTNPAKEDMSYVEAIKRDTLWLGLDCSDRVLFASDYYEQMYELAIKLIKKRRRLRGRPLRRGDERVSRHAVPDKNNITITPPGRDSPWRNRPVEENLDLFARMRAGEFADGQKTLRAKIDMAHPNLVMRDPPNVPDQARAALPHRKRLVHLSDVRLPGGDVRRD